MDRTLRSTPFGRAAALQLPFTTRLANLSDIPLSFKKTAARLLEASGNKIRHILFTPEFGTFGEYCPSTLFIVTDDEWLAMSTERSGAPSVRYADITQTRLLEFSLALLDGRLILESGETNEAACVLRFNLASRDLFQDAVSCMLAKNNANASDTPDSMPEFSRLSLGMRSSLHEAILPGDKCLALTSWVRADIETAADRLIIHPGGILLTEQQLCIFTADDPSDRQNTGDIAVYYRGVIYLSRHFPITGEYSSHGEIDELTLTVGNAPQASTASLYLPHRLREESDKILALLAQHP